LPSIQPSFAISSRTPAQSFCTAGLSEVVPSNAMRWTLFACALANGDASSAAPAASMRRRVRRV